MATTSWRWTLTTADVSSLGEVQDILKAFFAIDAKTAEMYKKNLTLALLEVAFRLPTAAVDLDDKQKGTTPRVVQIKLFLDQYFDKLSAFDDIKGYVADLTFGEARVFMQEILPKMLISVGFSFPRHQPYTASC